METHPPSSSSVASSAAPERTSSVVPSSQSSPASGAPTLHPSAERPQRGDSTWRWDPGVWPRGVTIMWVPAAMIGDRGSWIYTGGPTEDHTQRPEWTVLTELITGDERTQIRNPQGHMHIREHTSGKVITNLLNLFEIYYPKTHLTWSR